MRTHTRVLLGLVGVGLVALAVTACGSFGAGDLLSAAFDPTKRATLQQAQEDTQKAQEEFTPEQEYYIGRAVAATILGDSRYPPYGDAKARDYVNVLGLSLAYCSSMPETFGGWHFLVLDSAEINAFGAPSGYVLVSRELLRCAKSEDEVAAILAHEIGHVALKHGIGAIDKARKTSALLSIGKAAVAVAGSSTAQTLVSTFGDVIGDITKTLVNKGYSRELEYQADAAAIAILLNAGYDPRALVRMLEVMQTKWKKDGPGFMKTHPSPAERIKALEAMLPSVTAPAAAPAAAEAARKTRYQAALGKI
jgi:beta-barrel assembly-enhancing protease